MQNIPRVLTRPRCRTRRQMPQTSAAKRHLWPLSRTPNSPLSQHSERRRVASPHQARGLSISRKLQVAPSSLQNRTAIGPPPPEPVDATEATWQLLTRRIVEATAAAVPSSPFYEPSNPEPFLFHWRSAFAKLSDDVVSDRTIPEYVTRPPSKHFTMKLFGGFSPEGISCPCALPEVDGLIVRNEDGVTKGNVVKELSNWLFGEAPPRVHLVSQYQIEDEVATFEEVEGSDSPVKRQYVVPWLIDWHEHGIMWETEGEVTLYACTVEDFEWLTWTRAKLIGPESTWGRQFGSRS